MIPKFWGFNHGSRDHSVGEYMSFIFIQNMVNGACRDADPSMRYRNIIFGAFGKFGASLWVFFQQMNLRGDCFGIAYVKHRICGGKLR